MAKSLGLNLDHAGKDITSDPSIITADMKQCSIEIAATTANKEECDLIKDKNTEKVNQLRNKLNDDNQKMKAYRYGMIFSRKKDVTSLPPT